MLSRRAFITSAGGALTLVLVGEGGSRTAVAAEPPGALLDASSIPQFSTEMPRPGVMKRAKRVATPNGPADYYEIGVRQFQQQLLPPGFPATTVWGYGPASGSLREFATPAATIEARGGVPVRVKWINQLVDAQGRALPHLLPVDPTLHWANPEQRAGHMGRRTDSRPSFDGLTYVAPGEFADPATQYTTYTGPVPLVAHVHGAVGVGDESDGYPEAWTLPAASDLPASYARTGRWYGFFAAKAKQRFGGDWTPGSQVFQYPNDNRATTLWFHDHTLGLTRLNVYAGPVGFYLVRDDDVREQGVLDKATGGPASLPGPPNNNAQGHRGYEIPLAIQDRTFTQDGQLFYPNSRELFDGYTGPYVPQTPVSPVWNPEFFGNTLMTNGKVWPFATVEQRRYRLRLLNGCGSRVLILDFGALPGAETWQIGNDGGFLPEPLDLARQGGLLVLGPAERADVIVDFTSVTPGSYVLRNVGPDEPYNGAPVGSFEPADPLTTGRVLQFRVKRRRGQDRSTPPDRLRLPAPGALPDSSATRKLALLEHAHELGGEVGEGPTMGLLGRLETGPHGVEPRPLSWMDEVTENPSVGTTETWEIFNFTADAHPVHVHEVAFEVLGRQEFSLEHGHLTLGESTVPRPGELGRKDTVLAPPHHVTRIRATFGVGGQYVWHCHILEHEDNEMMRPYRIGPVQSGQPD